MPVLILAGEKTSCTYEDSVKGRQERREWREEAEKCDMRQTVMNGAVYEAIMKTRYNGGK